MPTAEQLRLRQEKISDWIKQLRDDPLLITKVPYNLKVDVLASALAQSLISAEDVPSKIANDVALNFVKNTALRQRDTAADGGTEVHGIIDRICQGEIFNVPSEYQGHINSWMKFRDDYGMTFVETEFTVYSPTHYYAGTGDFLSLSEKFPKWGLIGGDYKTSVSGIWPDIALQLSAIRYADFIGRLDLTEDRDTLPQIKTFIGVQITASGYKVVPVQVNEATFNVFLSAANVARWKRDFEQFALGKAEFVETPMEVASASA